ncbi:hypothetical protein Q9189_008270, partial [Teloschistes chrysophthalmus]
HFARECRSKVQRRQLNATLKKVPDDWEEVSREVTDSRDSDPLGTSSDEEFQFIENVEALQEAMKDNASLKTQAGLLGRTDVRSAFNQKPIPEDVPQAIAARPRTPYPEETSYQQRWDEEVNAITDILEEQLGSNASEDKVIPTPTLRRLNATIGTEHNSLSWTACYDDNCKGKTEPDGNLGNQDDELLKLRKSTIATLADAQAMIRSRCILRSFAGGIAKSHGRPELTHDTHFSEVSPTTQLRPAEEQFLHGRMAKKVVATFGRRTTVDFGGRHCGNFGTKSWKEEG